MCILGSEIREEQPITVSEMDDVQSSLPIEVKAVQDLSAPVFTKKIEDVVIDAGQEARFDARIHAVPEPKVEWYRGLVKLEDEGRFVHIDALKEDLFSLIIESTEPGDSGTFKCIATNEVGESTCDAQLTVKGPESSVASDEGEGPQITQPLKDVEVTEGESATLECKVSGKPYPSVAWYKDGTCVNVVERYKTRFDGELATLKIETTELEDEGEFKCVVENVFGSASCSSELLVNEANAKPVFEEKMKPVTINEGDPATFTVKVTGNPPPVIDWYRGKEQLEDKGRIEMVDSEETSIYSLTIKDTIPEDAGTYKCVAKNEEGEASSKAALAVKETITEPEFETEKGQGHEEATPIKVREGDVVSLSAVVKGTPPPAIEWYKDDEKLRETSRLKMDAKDGELSLIILEAKPDDSGVYKCEAKSKGGKAEKTFNVNVQGTVLVNTRVMVVKFKFTF